jgi:hypothetical protein
MGIRNAHDPIITGNAAAPEVPGGITLRLL